jgi:hypothetical protein
VKGRPRSARPAGLEPHIEALQAAEGLILVYPTSWYGLPAGQERTRCLQAADRKDADTRRVYGDARG